MAKKDDRANKSRGVVTINISVEAKDTLDRRYGAYVAKYGKTIQLIEFTAIQLNVGLDMPISEIHRIHEASNEIAGSG